MNGYSLNLFSWQATNSQHRTGTDKAVKTSKTHKDSDNTFRMLVGNSLMLVPIMCTIEDITYCQ